MTDGLGVYKTVFASTIKDGNLGRLFNRYIKFHYRLNAGDYLKIGKLNDITQPAVKIVARSIRYDKKGIGHKAYDIECTRCHNHKIIEEYDLLCSKKFCKCKHSSVTFSKVA